MKLLKCQVEKNSAKRNVLLATITLPWNFIFYLCTVVYVIRFYFVLSSVFIWQLLSCVNCQNNSRSWSSQIYLKVSTHPANFVCFIYLIVDYSILSLFLSWLLACFLTFFHAFFFFIFFNFFFFHSFFFIRLLSFFYTSG